MTILKLQDQIQKPVLADSRLDSTSNAASNLSQEKFQPAYYDMESGVVYLSRYADGRPAPIHMLDGLPVDVAKRLDINLVDGFLRKDRFYTREQIQRASTVTV